MKVIAGAIVVHAGAVIGGNFFTTRGEAQLLVGAIALALAVIGFAVMLVGWFALNAHDYYLSSPSQALAAASANVLRGCLLRLCGRRQGAGQKASCTAR